MATSTDPKPPPPASPTLQTFHVFPYLPYELRAEIWHFSTHEPRDIIPRIHYRPHPLLPPHRTMPTLATCFTPVPALLHVCRESREIGLKIYQRGCTELITPAMLFQHRRKEEERAEELRRLNAGEERRLSSGDAHRMSEEMEQGREGADGEGESTIEVEEKILKEEERYIYVNWEVDFLKVAVHEIWEYAALAGKVRRLAMTGSSDLLMPSFIEKFGKVEEIQIYCDDRFREWIGWVVTPNFWPCGIKNVLLIDGRNKEVAERERVRLADLKKYIDDEDKPLSEVWNCEEVVDALRESGVDGCECDFLGYHRTFDSDSGGADHDSADSDDKAGIFVPPFYNSMVGCARCYSVRGPVVERLLKQKKKGASEDI